MIKSLIVVSIICLAVSTSLESYAQAPDEAKSARAGNAAETANSGQRSAVATDGDQATAKAPNRGTVEVPLANLFPTRDSVAWRTMNSVVVQPSTPPRPRQETSGLQHEFHGESITIFNINNGVPH